MNWNRRPKSAIFTSPPTSHEPSHGRTQSFSPLGNPTAAIQAITRKRSNSSRGIHQSSNTFAPTFIKTEDLLEKVKGFEGENDFSGQRYVWLRDPDVAFVKGAVVEDLAGGQVRVQCEDGSV